MLNILATLVIINLKSIIFPTYVCICNLVSLIILLVVTMYPLFWTTINYVIPNTLQCLNEGFYHITRI